MGDNNRYYQYHNNTYFWSDGNRTGGNDPDGSINENRSSIVVVSILLFLIAVAPSVFALVQKQFRVNETSGSDGNTIALDDDLKDVELGSTAGDISQRSAGTTFSP